MIKKLNILFQGDMLLVILTVKKFLERFMKKNCKRQILKNLGKKSNFVYVKWKVYDHLIVGIIKKIVT